MVYNYSKTTYLALCGLFAAIMAVCSMITIPLGFTPVPVNLGTLGVFLTGGILGRKYGTISMSVYVLIGAIGVPVFAGFRGGLGVLAGPTGGYIIGYIVAVFLIGLLIEIMSKGNGDLGQRISIFAARSDEGERGASPAGSSLEDPSPTGHGSRRPGYATIVLSMIIGLLACYLLGTIWFIVSTGTGIWASLVACVFPFLPGDALKIAAATILVRRLRRII